ncbi:MAG: response regulator [Desulfobacterales bacterium]|nr:response regulator [Desulfobacterales bacterium]
MRDAAERSKNLTRQLLAFARKQIIAPTVLDLNKIVEGMLKMPRRLIGESIELVWLPSTEQRPVRVDPSQVDQILANLCVNAHDAIAGVGKVLIGTTNVSLDESDCRDYEGVVPGEYVLLTVSDNGCSMDKETRDNLYEPFFTTKEPGKGTGLGLATVYGIVKQNNGFINICSEPGQGATFKIHLPHHAAKVARMDKEAPAEPARGGDETILLVEDEPSILKMLETMLEHFGYTVLAADRPEEAIRVAKKHPGDIHLLITDVIMPGMNGKELARVLASLRPNLKCLYISGYTANEIAHHCVLDKGVRFMQKPFTGQELAAKVREVLDV